MVYTQKAYSTLPDAMDMTMQLLKKMIAAPHLLFSITGFSILLTACAIAPQPPVAVTINGLSFSAEQCGQYSVVPTQRSDMGILNKYIKNRAPKGLAIPVEKHLHASLVPQPGSLLEKALHHQGPLAFIDMKPDQSTFLAAYLRQCPAITEGDTKVQSLRYTPILNTLGWLKSQKETYPNFKKKLIRQQARRAAEKARKAKARLAALRKKQKKQEAQSNSAWRLTRAGSCVLRPIYPRTGVSFSVSEQLGLHVMSLKGKFGTSWLRIDQKKPYKSPYSYKLTKKIQFVSGIQYHVAGYGKGDEKAIIREMERGNTLYLSFVNSDGKRNSATFSLAGFTKAYRHFEQCVNRK